MAKTYMNSTKYEINAVFKIEGVVDKHDVVGAIFGQSEGLLGEDLDLRELQKNGKIGRIEINTAVQGGVTTGRVLVPSSLDLVETCIIGSTVETVDKVGPCNASFRVVSIKDRRMWKRDQIVQRAQDLLEKVTHEQIPETDELVQIVRERMRTSSITGYGPDKLPAGDGIEESDTVIVVEGRADVMTLLKNNIRNVIGMDGSKISQTIVDLSKKKKIIAFVDGDRGGDLILRKLMQIGKVDFIAKAPEGKEVEELTHKEIIMALRRKIPASASGVKHVNEYKKTNERQDYKQSYSIQRKSPQEKETETVKAEEKKVESEAEKYREIMDSLRGKLKAKIFDKDMKELATLGVRDLLKNIEKYKNAKTIVLDGIITKRLADAAESAGVESLVGVKLGKIETMPKKTKLMELS